MEIIIIVDYLIINDKICQQKVVRDRTTYNIKKDENLTKYSSYKLKLLALDKGALIIKHYL